MLIQNTKPSLTQNLGLKRQEREKEKDSFDKLIESSRLNSKNTKIQTAKPNKKEKDNDIAGYDNPNSERLNQNQRSIDLEKRTKAIKDDQARRHESLRDQKALKDQQAESKNNQSESKSELAKEEKQYGQYELEQMLKADKQPAATENDLFLAGADEQSASAVSSSLLSDNAKKTLDQKGLENSLNGIDIENFNTQDIAQSQNIKLPMKFNQSALDGQNKLETKLTFDQGSLGQDLFSADKTSQLSVGLGADFNQNSSDDESSALKSEHSMYMDQDFSMGNQEINQFETPLVQAMGGKDQSEAIENMQSIVQQARAFVDEGGGSMEIHLQPEGLGKVHLKVAVEDGHVNVQMLTDNVAAKKALEEGLFEIRTALEGHKLLVETLKVEMSQDYQKDFSDLKDNLQEQANRDFAEQFLGQFREEREMKTSGLFDGFRNYQRNVREPDMILNNRNPYTEKGKGQTINLVA